MYHLVAHVDVIILLNMLQYLLIYAILVLYPILVTATAKVGNNHRSNRNRSSHRSNVHRTGNRRATRGASQIDTNTPQ